ncbi:L,D-transpeptidase family protein [Thioalkalivibrio sp.]|uniref:L,D-transpeptidase family protein n=1 Tax=Thioalkalivibrio sp. TaxID=2093813 RepID=UPI0025E603B9|nr:L,D-transpeptidase family protein [Thioalkalivibrio sp.]
MAAFPIIVLLVAFVSSGAVLADDRDHPVVASLIEAALESALEERSVALGKPASALFSTLDAKAWFYADRGFAPAWDRNERLQRLVSALEGLEQDGLEPDLYGLAELRSRAAGEVQGVDAVACTDLLATRAYLNALLHLALGRLDPAQVDPIWRSGRAPALDSQRLRVIMLAGKMVDDPEGAIQRVRPDFRQYQDLRRAYARLAAQEQPADLPQIPKGPLLREGMSDPRVPLLRQRLAASPATQAEPMPAESVHDSVYDAELFEAVKAFQHAHHLQVDGIVGPETLAALNVPFADRLAQIRVNLERLRWLAREKEDNLVLVDIAGAEISYFRAGTVVWSARTQVGRPSRPTPRLRSEITHLTFNPTWTVPPTILRNDKLPSIREDIGYLERNRLRVLDYAGNRLDPKEIDWDNPSGFMLRQDPGPDNALGRVAIRFPNPFLVYLHDTPSQRHFAADRRALSSGCVRVERPMELVDLLMADGSDAGPDHAGRLVAEDRTRNFHLARPVPILLAYWTVDADADGNVRFRPDIYRSDERVARALAEQTVAARSPPGLCSRLAAVSP